MHNNLETKADICLGFPRSHEIVSHTCLNYFSTKKKTMTRRYSYFFLHKYQEQITHVFVFAISSCTLIKLSPSPLFVARNSSAKTRHRHHISINIVTFCFILIPIYLHFEFGTNVRSSCVSIHSDLIELKDAMLLIFKQSN